MKSQEESTNVHENQRSENSENWYNVQEPHETRRRMARHLELSFNIKQQEVNSLWVRSIQRRIYTSLRGWDSMCSENPALHHFLFYLLSAHSPSHPTWKNPWEQSWLGAGSHPTAYCCFCRERGHRTCFHLWRGLPGRCWSRSWLETNKEDWEQASWVLFHEVPPPSPHLVLTYITYPYSSRAKAMGLNYWYTGAAFSMGFKALTSENLCLFFVISFQRREIKHSSVLESIRRGFVWEL